MKHLLISLFLTVFVNFAIGQVQVIDNNASVGSLQGTLNISSTGASTYSIPLEVPSGISDLTPRLAITYNSQSGNSVVGYGWSIAGLSSITRTGNNLYYDNNIKSIQLTNSDNYMLDGQRLIGTLGSISTQYHTEIENYSKIVAHEKTINDAPTWFEVFSKDGLIYQYGKTDNSKVFAPGTETILTWNINKISDRNGNSINFEYINNNGLGLISNVSYTLNEKTNTIPSYSISFHYITSRPDVINYFVCGSKIQTDLLLSNIEIKSGLTTLRNYELLYTQGTYTLLDGIKLHDAINGKYLNPTLFNYNNSNNYLSSDISSYNNEYKYYYGDFNGDGLTDYTRIPRTLTLENNFWEMYLNDGNGNFNHANSGVISTYVDEGHGNEETELNSFGNVPYYYVSGGQGEFNTKILGSTFGKYSLDINGDGLGDLVWREIVNEPPIGEMYQFTIMTSTGSGFTPYSGSLSYYCGINDNYFILDLDGDGAEDFLSFNNETNEYKIAFYTNNVYNEYIGILPPVANFNTATKGDFNNNGKQELLIYNSFGLGSFEFNNLTKELDYISYSHNIDFTNDNYLFFTGDFNGDHNNDLLTYNNHWEIYISTGNGFTQNHDFTPSFINYDIENNDFIVIGDYNGDGMSDVAEFDNYDELFTNIKVNYSNGNTFIIEEIMGFGEVFPLPKCNVGDFNGDGNTDIMHYVIKSNGNYKESLYFHSFERPSLLTSVTNGFGVESKISYLPLTIGSNFYTKGEGEQYPVNDIQSPIYVVSSVTPDKDFGNDIETVYQYSGAKIHKLGKGFLGFKQIIENNKLQNTLSVTNNAIYKEIIDDKSVYYYPYVESSKVYSINQSGENRKILETINNLEIKKTQTPLNNLIFFPVLTSSTSYYWDNDINNTFIKTEKSTQNINDIDEYGNSTLSYFGVDPKYIGLNIPITEFNYLTKTENDFSNSIDIDNWLISRPDFTIVSKSDKENESKIYKTEFTYQDEPSENGYSLIKTMKSVPISVLPDQQQYFDSFTKQIDYKYDEFGHIIQKTANAPFANPSVEQVITYYKYENSDAYHSGYNHRFLTSILKHTPGDDYIKQYVYNPITTLLEKEISPTGLITNFEYAEFGNLTKTILPDDTYTLRNIYWLTEPESKYFYYIVTTDSKGASSKKYYDKFERERLNVSPHYWSSISTETQYDEKGRVKRVSEPMVSIDYDYIKWSDFEYYDDGRLMKEVTASGNEIFYQYEGNTTITTNNTTGVIITKNKDVLGRTTKISDPTGIVNYYYFSDGNLKEINASESHITMKYNPIGKQIELNDPNAGLIKYKYDAYGRIIQQSDNKGNIYELKYDDIGRLSEQNLLTGSEKTTYKYNDYLNVNGFGNLVETSMNGITYTYSYDVFGRLKTKSEKIMNEKYSFEYEYNAFGELNCYTYPSGFSVKYGYEKDGSLSSVKNNVNNETLWKLDDFDSYSVGGKITAFTLGNGLSTTLSYDQNGFGYLIGITTGNVQDLKYDWNIKTGNLNCREDLIYNIKEDFTYDEELKSRLKTWQVGQIKNSILYDNLGNVNQKSDVTYDGWPLSFIHYGGNAGPNAVTKITQPRDEYLLHASKQEIEYTPFNKTQRIDQFVVDSESKVGGHNYTYGLVYGPDRTRKISVLYKDYNIAKMKHYIGDYEVEIDKDGNKRKLHYISGGNGLFAIYVENKEKDTLYYIHKDHLGSFYCISDEQGNIVENGVGNYQVFSFDPWGRRRNPFNWTFNDVPKSFIFDRGYTGHEHLDIFGLINMNGRTYDPWLGRMLQPDNYVQAAGYLQNYNRYSYALNNPLKYTDPTGDFIIQMGIGAIAGMAQGLFTGALQGLKGVELLRSMALGGLHGAIGGLAGGAAGNSILNIKSTGALEGALLGSVNGAIAGGLSGGFTSALSGGNFWDGAKYGAVSGAVGGAFSGGYAGYKFAQSKGVNPFTGGSLQDKLNSVVEQYKFLFELGQSGSNGLEEILVASDENLSKYKTGYKETDDGFFYSSSKDAKARGLTKPILRSMCSADGNVLGFKSRVFISKQVIREAFYYGSPRALGTFMHEYSHVNDYFSGYFDYTYNNNYQNSTAAEYWSEFRAYSRAYNFTGSGRDLNRMNYFANKLKLYF